MIEVKPGPILPQEGAFLSAKDIKTIDDDITQNPTVRFLKNIDSMRYSIGDILIRQTFYRNSWQTKMVSHVSKVPVKYVYVFENEEGVGYVKQLLANGDPSNTLVCMANINPNVERFIVDPDYTDHILLSDKDVAFDAGKSFADAKKSREAIHRQNKKLKENVSNNAKVIEIFQAMKPGDKFWFAWDMVQASRRECTLSSVTVRPRKIHQWASEFDDGSTNMVANIVYTDSLYKNNNSNRTSIDFINTILFTKKPYPYDDSSS